MHLITFGTDEHMLNASSKQHERLLSYVPLVDSLTAIIFTKKTDWAVRDIGNLKLIQVPKKGLLFNLYKTYKYLKQSKRTSGDTVISAQDPFEVGFITWIFSVLLGYPLHLQIHSAVQSDRARTESLRSRIQYMLFVGLRSRARAIRVVSKPIKDFLISKGLAAENIFVSPVVAEPATTFKTEKYTGGTIRLLSVGRFVPVKNLMNLIEAFSVISKKYDTHLTIVGGGPLQNDLVIKVKELGLGDKVSVSGWVNDIGGEYLKSNIYVHSSYHEGYGMTTVEALTRGVPVVATPYGGSTEYIIQGKNGYITAGFNADDIARGIEEAIAYLLVIDPTAIRNSVHVPTQAEASAIQLESWEHALNAN